MNNTLKAVLVAEGELSELDPPIDWRNPDTILPSREQISLAVKKLSFVCKIKADENEAVVNLQTIAFAISYLLDVSTCDSLR